MGVHALGYVAEKDEAAAEDFFPGYAAEFTKIGKERGWGPVTRGQFDALRGPKGALIVGGPDTVAAKVLHYSESLGGISRLSFQMSVSALPHAKLLEATRLLGEKVAPAVRQAVGGREG